MKRIARKSSSSFGKLADYILDSRNKGSKVVESWTTNCNEDFEIAVAEITAKQALNTRARSDKTYHMVISFPAGEIPTREQLKDIEDSLCESIGLGEHSRIAAAHHDTDHFHLHLAISKVHPQTLRMFEPYYDKIKLQETSRELEKKHRLERLYPTSEPKNDIALESHRGMQSFESWLKENVKAELDLFLLMPDKNWRGFHKILQEHGVTLRPNGAGFVFSHASEKLYVKASSIGRNFSKKGLEGRLGPFVPRQEEHQVKKRYTPGPIHKSKEAESLYSLYSFERKFAAERRSVRVSEKWDKRQGDVKKIFDRYKEKKTELQKDWLLNPTQKRNVYRAIQENLKKELERANAEYEKEKKLVQERYPLKPSWPEWLREQAQRGDSVSLEVLRSRERKPSSPIENNIVGRGQEKPNVPSELLRKVSKDGGIKYTLPGKTSFVDRGKVIHVLSRDQATVEAAVRHAVAKFGHNIAFDGLHSFTSAAKAELAKLVAEQTNSRTLQRNRGPER